MSKSTEDHVIKIKCKLDDKTFKCIKSIVEKRQTKIGKIENDLIIH